MRRNSQGKDPTTFEKDEQGRGTKASEAGKMRAAQGLGVVHMERYTGSYDHLRIRAQDEEG